MAVIDSTATGNFSVGATWVGGVSPGTGDDARIMNTHNVTVDVDGEVTGSCEIQAGGTLTLTGTNKLILDDENGAGYAFDNDGTLVANTGTLEFTYTGTTLIDAVGTAGNPYNLICNHASLVLTQDTALSVDNDFTITLGQLTTSVSNYGLTVTNATSITGTLTCNASAVSLGSGTGAAGGMEINSGGTLSGGSGTHTFGGAYCKSGGSWTATSGTTTINGVGIGISPYAFSTNNATAFNHSNGTLTLTYAGDVYLATKPASAFYNLTINTGTGNTVTHTAEPNGIQVDNGLTITSGELNTNSSNYALTVTGDVSITGTLTGNASAISVGSCTINAGGTYSATSGTTTITDRSGSYSIVMNGTFTHNNGTVEFTTFNADARVTGGNHLYNVIMNRPTAKYIRFTSATTIANDLTVTSGTVYCDNDAGTSYNLTVSGDVSITDLAGIRSGGGYSGSAWTLGSLTINSGGTYSATSGTTTITGPELSGYVFWNKGTFTHNNGTVTFTNTDISRVDAGGDDFYNYTINSASSRLWQHTNLTIANDLTVTLGNFRAAAEGGGARTITVTGDVSITGTVTGYASTISMGSCTINSGGTYSATSGTTSMTGRAGTGYVITVAAGGTLTHNNGNFTVTSSTGADGRFNFGASSVYDLVLNSGNAAWIFNIRTNDLTVANNLTITQGVINTWAAENNALTVTGATSITGTLTCNSSDVVLTGLITVNGELSAPDGSGSFTFGNNLQGTGTFTHNDGTATSSANVQKTIKINNIAFYNLTSNNAGTFGMYGEVTSGGSIYIENTLTINSGKRWLIGHGAGGANYQDWVIGTATSSGSIINNGIVDTFTNTVGSVVRAYSEDYPVICTGTDWNWDKQTNAVVTIQDLTYIPDATIGPGVVTVTANRVDFRGTLTVTNATLEGTMCTIDVTNLTVSSGLYIDGWFDLTDATRGGYNWILVGGDYTIAANLNYTTPHHFYKPGAATLTLDTGITLGVTDCTVDGTYITAEADLLDTNNGAFTVRYNVDMRVLTLAGVGISGAAVTCDDTDGNQLWTDTTNGSGDISTQVTTYEVYGAGADTNAPHEITITASGYVMLVWVLTIDNPVAMFIPLDATGTDITLPLTATLTPGVLTATVDKV